MTSDPMTPPPDARESALDIILHWMDIDGYGVPIGVLERLAAARAELSALRASQGAVARELVELVDEYASEMRRLLDEDEEHEESGGCFSIVGMSTADVRDWLARYDALRPAATGEAISVDNLRDAFIEGWHASAEELDEPYDAKKALSAWAESASKHDARAAIARAEGRKDNHASQ